MYFESFLPFVTELGYLEKNKKDIVNVSDVYCPLTYSKSLEDIEKDSVVKSFMAKKVLKVAHIMPLNIKVFLENDILSYYIKNTRANDDILMDISYINYEDVAKTIEVKNGTASIEKNGASLIQEGIISEYFVNSASNGISIDITTLQGTDKEITIPISDRVSIFNMFLPSTQNKKKVKAVSEKLDAEALLKKALAGQKMETKVMSEDYIYNWLDGYFKLPEGQEMTNDNGREVVPLLIGPTGVFKSATVKELCKKYNFRLVDFRVAFTSRLDYSGLYHKDVIDGEDFSFACPMEEIVTCSDGFREYCVRAVAKLKETLSRGTLISEKTSSGKVVSTTETPLTDEQIQKINEMIANYNEYQKTPVLFFDEITRNKNKGVEGVLIQMLNQKRFNDMTLFGCKFVAATNLNLEYDEINEVYDVNDDIDKAFSNRFMPLKVLPKDVQGRWFDWANLKKKDSENSNIHPLIVQYLEKNDDKVYDESVVVKTYNNADIDATIEAAATPYPNYRTWELTSNLVYSSKDKAINMTILEGLVGKDTANSFMSFLETQGYTRKTLKETDDDVGSFLEDNLEAGLPSLLIGPSSLGKTARVNSYAKKVEKRTGKKPEIIHINLASMDNVDVMGMPVKKTLTSYITEDTVNDSAFKFLNKEFKDIAKDIRQNSGTGFVEYLTVRSPDRGIKERFMEALKEDNMVILFFDECNRVTNSSMMSAMFEAISDYRIFGINFREQKDNVRVIAACNLGVEYGGAKGLDAALSARFSVYWKKDFDMRDVNSYIQFLKDEVEDGKIDGLLVEYLESLSKDDVLYLLKKVEDRSIENAEPSSRMLYQMSKDIKNMRGRANKKGEYITSVFNGSLLFNSLSNNKVFDFNDNLYIESIPLSDKVNQAVDIARYVKSNSTRWEALLNDKSAIIDGESVKAHEILEVVQDTANNLKTYLAQGNEEYVKALLPVMQNLITVLQDMDRNIEDTRKSTFEAYSGIEFTRGFLPYFNERFGGEDDIEITIEMLDDVNLMDKFFSKELSKIASSGPDEKILHSIKLIEKFYDVWKKSLPAVNYSAFFEGIMSIQDTGDNVIMLLRKLGPTHDEFMVKAEESGDDFIYTALKSYPNKISPEQLKTLKSQVQSGTTQAKPKKARLL